MYNISSDPTNDAKLAYDLRQIYAKLVGEHLIDVSSARKQKNFPDYFDALEDLYIVTKHNFRGNKNKKNKNKKQKKTYKSLKEEFIKIVNKYSQAYLGNSQNAEELSKIKEALNNMEKHLWFKIKEAKMIGVKDGEEGLL